ncbi:MAG: tetratricopeptide repeat protein [Labilithrix sp.]|nr:tetratricopeptide repeat protein [Labilithrix sp.]
MERSTILKPTDCDLKRLPLGALEAFMLSQLDGQLTLEEIAEVCSLGLADASRIAERLLELGAVRESAAGRTPRPVRGNAPARAAIEEDARRVSDPRSEAQPRHVDAAAHDGERRRRRSSRPSLRVRAAVPRGSTAGAANADADEPRELDEILREGLDDLDAPASEARRAERDAPPPPEAGGAGPSGAPAASKTPPPRKPSKALRLSSRRMSAARKQTPTPTSKAKTATPAGGTRGHRFPAPPEEKKQRASAAPAPAPPAEASPQRSAEKWRQLRAAAREVEIQARVEPLLRAAEAALKGNDPIGAANNFRLALQHREDPFVRLKLEDADRLAKAVRFERSLASARAAEEDRRWADAAVHYGRAHGTKPTAEIADRAANALRASEGDLERAATLAEQAVALDPRNARYRVTLGEVCLAAKLLTRAQTHAEIALELAPRDPRAKALAAAIAKAKKEQT